MRVRVRKGEGLQNRSLAVVSLSARRGGSRRSEVEDRRKRKGLAVRCAR